MNEADRARLDSIEEDVEEIKKDVKEIRAWSNRVEGGRVVLFWLASAAATLLSIAVFGWETLVGWFR
jgi:phage-related protein